MKTYSVGILGATGAVGQKFIRLLENHPWFQITHLGASERSAGKPYAEAVNWVEPTQLPEKAAHQIVLSCDPNAFKGVDFVFSGLDSSVATEVELAFAQAGIPVISNAKNYRTHDAVPLLIPEVNPDHIKLIKKQSFDPKGNGFIVTNPNCVVVPLVMSLRPLYDAFGIEAVIVTSLQAVSGAGYPGVPSLDIMGNVVPFIGDEEDKIEHEPLKLLARLDEGTSLDFAKFPVHATATRVPVINGHTLSVTVKLARQPEDLQEVRQAFEQWENPISKLDLPTAPSQPVRVHENPQDPQPRKHAEREKGMQAGIGRLRMAHVFDVSYVALAHNTIRGAAGGAILNAELLVKKGYIS